MNDTTVTELAAVVAAKAAGAAHLDELTAGLDLDAFGLRLPATLAFDYPTPAALAEYIWSEEFQEKATPTALLGELDKLESLLSEMAPDDAARKLVTARLQGFLSTWSSVGIQPKSKTVAQKLGSTSDDEILDFLNKELGRS